ncbi:MAG: hypothetical protein ACJATI_003928 [Halioglobus sp.]
MSLLILENYRLRISQFLKPKIIFESDLILKDLKNNRKRKFKFEHYFDKCQGRLTAKWNWGDEGKIKQVFYGDNKFYYAIEFETGTHVEGRNGNWYFEHNSNFDKLKDEVKNLPKSKWNPE